MEVIQETEEDRLERVQKWRLASALREAPELLAHVRSIAVSGRSERGETLGEWTAPMRITAADDSDSVYASLVGWVMFLAQSLEVAPPSVTAVAWSRRDTDAPHGRLLGFRAHTSPEAASVLIGAQTMWLRIHDYAIVDLDEYVNYRGQVLKGLWDLRSKYPMRPRRERSTEDRECPACGRWMVKASWFTDDMRDAEVRCYGCGHMLTAPVKVLDALDWDTRENRQCTCRYEGDPKGQRSCPVHQTDDLRSDLQQRLFLRPAELAALLRVEKRTVNRWIADEANPLATVRWDGQVMVETVEGLRYAADEERRSRA